MKSELSRTFLNEEERSRIERAVAEVEKTTAGEVVPVVVDQSDDYRDARILSTLSLSFPATMIVMILLDQDTVWHFVPLMIVASLPAWVLTGRVNRFLLPFIGGRRREGAVRNRAELLFYQLGLHETRHRSGIMIFVSVLERKAWILADRGINERIDPGRWQEIVSRLSRGLAEGERSGSLCRAIEECGLLLAKHFPPDESNPDELPNLILA